jgi:hypothetical protein
VIQYTTEIVEVLWKGGVWRSGNWSNAHSLSRTPQSTATPEPPTQTNASSSYSFFLFSPRAQVLDQVARKSTHVFSPQTVRWMAADCEAILKSSAYRCDEDRSYHGGRKIQ